MKTGYLMCIMGTIRQDLTALAGSIVHQGLIHHDQPCGVRSLNPVLMLTLFQQWDT
jgi:hypothetical protein